MSTPSEKRWDEFWALYMSAIILLFWMNTLVAWESGHLGSCHIAKSRRPFSDACRWRHLSYAKTEWLHEDFITRERDVQYHRHLNVHEMFETSCPLTTFGSNKIGVNVVLFAQSYVECYIDWCPLLCPLSCTSARFSWFWWCAKWEMPAQSGLSWENDSQTEPPRRKQVKCTQTFTEQEFASEWTL